MAYIWQKAASCDPLTSKKLSHVFTTVVCIYTAYYIQILYRMIFCHKAAQRMVH